MSTPDFFDMIRDRYELGARTIAIAESAEIEFLVDHERERGGVAWIADVAVYAKLLSDRIRKIAARVDAWERQGIARMMQAPHRTAHEQD